uniref:Uncharacterized protein C5orf52 homolog n=1 Tax=Geotrypetes seraphini TaxID=260995 RepID=A0A6P8S0R2_GEOSA|nr:uncharacterized protein C5orf52 homolog [Geotrypetes seraphini]
MAAQGIASKTHLSRVIIHDNISERRILELKEKHEEDLKKKTEIFHDSLKKRFLSNLQKKNSRWAREHDHFIRYLEMEHRNKKNVADLSAGQGPPKSHKKTVGPTPLQRRMR